MATGSFLSDTGCEGRPRKGTNERDGEVMNRSSKVAVKAVGIVVASFLTIGVTTVQADAASTKVGTVKPLDSGWPKTR